MQIITSAYSKSFILNEDDFIYLNMNKIIKYHLKTERNKKGYKTFEQKEKMYYDNYIERTKKNLVKSFMSNV